MSRHKNKLKVLHLDDDIFETERVQKALEKHSIECQFQVTSTRNAEDYLKLIAQSEKPDIAILDIHVGDNKPSGVELAIKTREMSRSTVILICSTADDVKTIAGCLSAGVDDFISKNSDKGEFSLRVFNSYRLAMLKQGFASDQNPRTKIKPIGATMNRISQRIPLIVKSAVSAVFIRGESGTGKEVVADLFGASLPAGSPFVKVNCGAISPSLLESELFGYIKGAFTGALTDKKGLLESASDGWIFLDEVATLSPSAQVALLRVLENQEVLRVGATKPNPIKIRMLSATNEPIETLIKKKRFRGDLWQRLRETEIDLPPLRQRPEEIPSLIENFCKLMPGGPYTASGPVIEVLSTCKWDQGNIRELRNCLRAMTEMHVNKLLTPLAIPERIWQEIGRAPNPSDTTLQETSTLQLPDARSKLLTKPMAIKVEWKPFTQNLEYLMLLFLAEVIKALSAAGESISLLELSSALGLTQKETSKKITAMIQSGIAHTSEIGPQLASLTTSSPTTTPLTPAKSRKVDEV